MSGRCLSRREVLKHRRKGHAGSTAEWVDGGPRGSAQERAPTVLLDFDLTQIDEIIDAVAKQLNRVD